MTCMYMYKTDITIKAAVLLRKYLREISGLWGCGVDKYAQRAARKQRMGGHLVASFSLLFLESWGMGFFHIFFFNVLDRSSSRIPNDFYMYIQGRRRAGALEKKKSVQAHGSGTIHRIFLRPVSVISYQSDKSLEHYFRFSRFPISLLVQLP